MAARFSAAGAGDGQLGACPRVIVRWPEAFACGAPLGATAAAAAAARLASVLDATCPEPGRAAAIDCGAAEPDDCAPEIVATLLGERRLLRPRDGRGDGDGGGDGGDGGDDGGGDGGHGGDDDGGDGDDDETTTTTPKKRRK